MPLDTSCISGSDSKITVKLWRQREGENKERDRLTALRCATGLCKVLPRYRTVFAVRRSQHWALWRKTDVTSCRQRLLDGEVKLIFMRNRPVSWVVLRLEASTTVLWAVRATTIERCLEALEHCWLRLRMLFVGTEKQNRKVRYSPRTPRLWFV
jgi:hypothetical protein